MKLWKINDQQQKRLELTLGVAIEQPRESLKSCHEQVGIYKGNRHLGDLYSEDMDGFDYGELSGKIVDLVAE